MLFLVTGIVCGKNLTHGNSSMRLGFCDCSTCSHISLSLIVQDNDKEYPLNSTGLIRSGVGIPGGSRATKLAIIHTEA